MYSAIQILLTIMGSGALFSFIQFMINRKDTRNDKIKDLEKEIQEGLEARENKGKERYDEHHEAIEELRDMMKHLAKTTKEQQKYTECVGNVLIGLAQDKIVYLTQQYTERGAITLDELAVLEGIYVPYHDGLGGNGRGKAGYERCKSLPIISEEKARKIDKQIS